MPQQLLKVDDLKVHFPVKGGFLNHTKKYVYAVDGVSLYLNKGETLGIVGESGCGKTTTALSIINLVTPTAGKITFEGKDVTGLKGLNKKEVLALRKNMQVIFQDPYYSLNPRMSVNSIIEVPMKIHGIGDKKERKERVAYLLDKVGLSPQQGTRYPHEFSGGQRQRIGIARALSLSPKVIIGDEPVSALDVSIQAQIINLLMDLQEEFDLSYLFVSHDLGVVEHVSDRILVMYLGKVVETAPYEKLYSNPQHPYTKALLSAVPIADPRQRTQRISLEGDVPSPLNPPSGCAFHPRCPYCTQICKEVTPVLALTDSDQWVSCHNI